MTRDDIATPEETLEAEMAIMQAAGIRVRHVGYQKGIDKGFHLYDVLEPTVPGYVSGRDSGYPTLSFDGIKERGLIR